MTDIIVDIESTGLDPERERIVEIAAIEIGSGRRFHALINPGRPIPPDAARIHGITDEKVANAPSFAQIAHDFLDWLGVGNTLVAHNAEFDLAFLNAELGRAGLALLANRVVDTLALANKAHPLHRNTLDALCRRFDISLKRRKLHGALLDCELLTEVYDRLLNGDRQGGFDFTASKSQASYEKPDYSQRGPRKSLITEEEFAAWTAFKNAGWTTA